MQTILIVHSRYSPGSHYGYWTSECRTIAPRGSLCVFISQIDYNLKSWKQFILVYCFILQKRKWGSEILSDLPKATPLITAGVGIHTCPTGPRAKTYTALPPPPHLLVRSGGGQWNRGRARPCFPLLETCVSGN